MHLIFRLLHSLLNGKYRINQLTDKRKRAKPVMGEGQHGWMAASRIIPRNGDVAIPLGTSMSSVGGFRFPLRGISVRSGILLARIRLGWCHINLRRLRRHFGWKSSWDDWLLARKRAATGAEGFLSFARWRAGFPFPQMAGPGRDRRRGDSGPAHLFL